jgi:hypothetical protein
MATTMARAPAAGRHFPFVSNQSIARSGHFALRTPAPTPLSYTEPETTLDDVVARLTDHLSEQAVGTRLSQADQRRQRALMKQLRERNLRPIVAIARATMKDAPGIEVALRMPDASLGLLKLVAQAKAIAEAAALYSPAFVKNGLPADFLDQLKATIVTVKESTIGRATNVGRQVGAKAGIGQELKRGRDALVVLDAIVKLAFEGNASVLREWEVAMRVKGVPGGGAVAPTSAPAPTPAAPVIVAPVKAAA